MRNESSVSLEVVTDDQVTEGDVTINIVSGPENSAVCVNDQTGRGIVGPGTLPPTQPIIPLVCIKLDQKTSMQVTRGADYCATKVRFFTTTDCTGPATNVEGVRIPGLIYSGDPGGNVRCGEILRQTQKSPTRFTYESGGVLYEFCYDNETGNVLDCGSF